MTISLTTNFSDIQERHIDPYSKVNSDNTNMLLKALGKEKCITRGFELTLIPDDTSDPPDSIPDRVVAAISPGIAIKDYVVIEFKETVNLKLFDIGDAVHLNDRLYIVLDYKYGKVYPQPIATLKVIDPLVFDPNRQILLYIIKFNYDAGSDPVNIDYIEVHDYRYRQSTSKYRFETTVYVGGANAGVQVDPLFPIEYQQYTDITLGNYLIYPEAYVTDTGYVMVIVNSAFIGHEIVLTTLDDDTVRYVTPTFCNCGNPYTVTVTHGLNNTYNIVAEFWYDSTLDRWAQVEPQTIHFVNSNVLEVTNAGLNGETMIIKVYPPDYEENVAPDVANDTFIIEHNLDQMYPIVQCVDLNTNNIIIPDTVRFIDTNKLEVTFGSSIFGTPVKVLVKKGTEYYLSLTDTTELIIIHNLGYIPLDWIQVVKLDEYWDVEPELITFLDKDRIKIKFDETVESWFWLSMGVVMIDTGCRL